MTILGCSREWQLHFNYRAAGFSTAPDGRAFLDKAHSLPLSISPLMLVKGTQQEMTIWEYILIWWILFPVAWLDLCIQSDLNLPWKLYSFRHFATWRGKDREEERFMFIFHFCIHLVDTTFTSIRSPELSDLWKFILSQFYWKRTSDLRI